MSNDPPASGAPAGDPCKDPREALKTLAQAGLDSLFGAPGAPVARAAGPCVTLRYGTLSKDVPAAEAAGQSIGDLFDAHASDLGGVTLGENTTIRDTDPSAGGVVSDDDPAVVGRTYVASIRKEDKGAL